HRPGDAVPLCPAGAPRAPRPEPSHILAGTGRARPLLRHVASKDVEMMELAKKFRLVGGDSVDQRLPLGAGRIALAQMLVILLECPVAVMPQALAESRAHQLPLAVADGDAGALAHQHLDQFDLRLGDPRRGGGGVAVESPVSGHLVTHAPSWGYAGLGSGVDGSSRRIVSRLNSTIKRSPTCTRPAMNRVSAWASNSGGAWTSACWISATSEPSSTKSPTILAPTVTTTIAENRMSQVSGMPTRQRSSTTGTTRPRSWTCPLTHRAVSC